MIAGVADLHYNLELCLLYCTLIVCTSTVARSNLSVCCFSDVPLGYCVAFYLLEFVSGEPRVQHAPRDVQSCRDAGRKTRPNARLDANSEQNNKARCSASGRHDRSVSNCNETRITLRPFVGLGISCTTQEDFGTQPKQSNNKHRS